MFGAGVQRGIVGAFGLLLVAAAGAASADNAPLQSKGPWRVEYPEQTCLLSRSFVDGDHEAVVGWLAMPLLDFVQLTVLQQREGEPFRRGKAVVSVEPGKNAEADLESFQTTQPGQHATRLWVPTSIFDDMGDRAVLSIAPEGEKPLTFALERPAKGFGALATCKKETLKNWGVDADEAERVAKPPEGQGGYWLKIEDYPPSALRNRQEGTTVILYRIGVTGLVDECRTVMSSGVPALDATTCNALTKRGRFSPARDASGAPMAVHGTRRVVWRLPRG